MSPKPHGGDLLPMLCGHIGLGEAYDLHSTLFNMVAGHVMEGQHESAGNQMNFRGGRRV
jgi:hypothetical protein